MSNPLKKGPEIKLSSMKPSALKAVRRIKVTGLPADIYYDLRTATCCRWRSCSSSRSSPSRSRSAAPAPRPEADVDGERAQPRRRAVRRPASRRAGRRGGARPARLPPAPRRARRPRILSSSSMRPTQSEDGRRERRRCEHRRSTPATFSTGSPSTGSPSTPESGGSSEPPTTGKLTYYSYAIDVRISAAARGTENATVRRNLPELTMLPSRETPAIVYMGVDQGRQEGPDDRLLRRTGDLRRRQMRARLRDLRAAGAGDRPARRPSSTAAPAAPTRSNSSRSTWSNPRT